MKDAFEEWLVEKAKKIQSGSNFSEYTANAIEYEILPEYIYFKKMKRMKKHIRQNRPECAVCYCKKGYCLSYMAQHPNGHKFVPRKRTKAELAELRRGRIV